MQFTKNGTPATEINWVAPTTRADGESYGAADHAGYDLGVSDGTVFNAHVSVPASYDILSWPLDQLNLLEEGTYDIALRTVDTAGRVSVWSTPAVVTVTLALPSEPTNFTVV